MKIAAGYALAAGLSLPRKLELIGRRVLPRAIATGSCRVYIADLLSVQPAMQMATTPRLSRSSSLTRARSRI